ncbi:immunoglobulin lambda-1 light chain-like [Cololabis saira]|uniref:immunoglobulin lambda-1 light chain-like n=1 Tax=Cololabis saira TaxID=129043 RepID=UPI002AD31C17|nr:immunoglobulin lambda-1 light chain-like [Cololabis saira]
MLFLPAAALCCLCSALVAMAAELVQDDVTLTRRVGQSVSFSCGRTDHCDLYWVFWYQKKEMETFRVINEINRGSCNINSGFNHPQKADFSAENTQNDCSLKLNRVKLDHSATYYCMCVKIDAHRNHCHIFGRGSKLYVTDEQVVKPVVSVYPAASRVHLGGGSSLLCVASAMFPPGVRFSWKRQKKNGPLEDVPPAEGEQVELREPGRSASIIVVHRLHQDTYRYSCYVKHEGGTVEAQTQEPADLPAPADPGSGVPAPAVPGSGVPAPADPGSGVPAPADPGSEIFQSECRVKLLCLLYTVLTLKSLLYCCGLSLLMVLRNKGPSTN